MTSIIQRITEIAGVVVSFDPKPIPVSLLLIYYEGHNSCVICDFVTCTDVRYLDVTSVELYVCLMNLFFI